MLKFDLLFSLDDSYRRQQFFLFFLQKKIMLVTLSLLLFFFQEIVSVQPNEYFFVLAHLSGSFG